jgi:hypothetical protein
MAAQQCIGMTDKKVVVIPTKTVPQGISAMLALEPENEEEDNTQAMTEAAKNVHTAQVTYAARDSEFDGKQIKAGEYIVLLESALVANGPDLKQVLETTAAKMAEFSPELVTIYTGADASEDEKSIAQSVMANAIPAAETTMLPGGQPVYYFMISAE